MTLQNDNLSPELIQVLDHLANDVNRKILQLLYDKGPSTLEIISEYLSDSTRRSLSIRLASFERCSLVILEHDNARRRIVSVKLTPFAQILLMSLFFAQILLEEKN